MKFVFYTNSVSPHQLPLARELVARLGSDNYRYIYTESLSTERVNLGWSQITESWIIRESENKNYCRKILLTCDILLCGLRDWDLLEARGKRGLKTFYASERWFKPLSIFSIRNYVWRVPGSWRMIIPTYRFMVHRLVKLVENYPSVRILSYGVWAARDFEQMGIPSANLHIWGYAVEPHKGASIKRASLVGRPLRVLWIGRMIEWKRADTLIRAVAMAANKGCSIRCTLVGAGPYKIRWQSLAFRLMHDYKLTDKLFDFRESLPITAVRDVMCQHDVCVLTSNACEGWGAVVNEALEEGMWVIGTHEAGSSATLLPETNRFACGDFERLTNLLCQSENLAHVSNYTLVSLVDQLLS